MPRTESFLNPGSRNRSNHSCECGPSDEDDRPASASVRSLPFQGGGKYAAQFLISFPSFCSFFFQFSAVQFSPADVHISPRPAHWPCPGLSPQVWREVRLTQVPAARCAHHAALLGPRQFVVHGGCDVAAERSAGDTFTVTVPPPPLRWLAARYLLLHGLWPH